MDDSVSHFIYIMMLVEVMLRMLKCWNIVKFNLYRIASDFISRGTAPNDDSLNEAFHHVFTLYDVFRVKL